MQLQYIYNKEGFLCPAGLASFQQGDIKIDNLSIIFDTGASHTFLHPAIAQKFNINTYGSVHASSGDIRNCSLTSGTITLFDKSDSISFNKEIVVSESAVDMLIGMDVLKNSQFVFMPHEDKYVFTIIFPD